MERHLRSRDRRESGLVEGQYLISSSVEDRKAVEEEEKLW